MSEITKIESEFFATVEVKKNIIRQNGKIISKDDLKSLLASKVCLLSGFDATSFVDRFEISLHNKTVTEKALTPDQKRQYLEDGNNYIQKKLSELHESIPFRFMKPKNSMDLIILIVTDFDNKIVLPILAGHEKLGWVGYMDSDETFQKFVTELLIDIVDVNGWTVGRSELIEMIRYYCMESTKVESFRITKFETFSFNKDEWKVSYIDPKLIDSSDGNISAWEGFKKSINNQESWELFCAWIYGIFDPTCIKNNRQILWLFGEGFDGKSAITQVIQSIISGKLGDNYGSITMGVDQMDAKFWGSDIYGKALTTINEVTDPNIIHGSLHSKIHAWTGHDSVSIEGKGKGIFSDILYSRCMMHANIEPTFDSGHINQITRCIPIEIKETFFKGLGNKTKYKFGTKSWQETLFEQRFSFLKVAREYFYERYNDQHLFYMTDAHQESTMAKSDYTVILQEISSYITPGNNLWNPSDVMMFFKWLMSQKTTQKISSKGIKTIYTEAKIVKKNVRLPNVKDAKLMIFANIDERQLRRYNEAMERDGFEKISPKYTIENDSIVETTKGMEVKQDNDSVILAPKVNSKRIVPAAIVE